MFRHRGTVLVDTNVILEVHQTGSWRALTGGYTVETVEDCVTETQTGFQRRRPEHRIDQAELRDMVLVSAFPPLGGVVLSGFFARSQRLSAGQITRARHRRARPPRRLGARRAPGASHGTSTCGLSARGLELNFNVGAVQALPGVDVYAPGRCPAARALLERGYRAEYGAQVAERGFQSLAGAGGRTEPLT